MMDWTYGSEREAQMENVQDEKDPGSTSISVQTRSR